MPSFLDFVFEFKSQDYPLSTTTFRQEDYLRKDNAEFELKCLGRSGLLIQHGFNLLAIEHETRPDEYHWPRRHTTVYHSFDPKNNKAVWIIVKGNSLIRDRLTTGTHNQQHLGSGRSVEASFSATLKTLLIIFEWCLENWTPYTDFLEGRARKTSVYVKHVPVSDAISEIPAKRALVRRSTMDTIPQSRASTGLSEASVESPRLSGRIRRSFSRLASPRSIQTNVLEAEGNAPETEIKNIDFEKILTFEELQRHRSLADEVDRAIMVIDQNKRVLADIVDYYKEVTESGGFKTYVSENQYQSEVLNFLQRLRSIERDLDNYQRRLRSLLKGLEKDESLVSIGPWPVFHPFELGLRDSP